MKRLTKRALSFLLAAAMLMSIMSPAIAVYAEDETGSGSVEATDDAIADDGGTSADTETVLKARTLGGTLTY